MILKQGLMDRQPRAQGSSGSEIDGVVAEKKLQNFQPGILSSDLQLLG